MPQGKPTIEASVLPPWFYCNGSVTDFDSLTTFLKTIYFGAPEIPEQISLNLNGYHRADNLMFL